MKYYIGIDLGGTNIKAGVVDENYNILSKADTKTKCPRPAAKIVDDMAKVALEAVKKSELTIDDIQWVGVGAPGTANRHTGIVEYANNLDFKNVHLRDMISRRLHLPTYIENDANAATYGECLAGVAKEYDNVLGVTLGTGLGGGIVINKKIYNGFNHAAGEMGHNVIIFNGRQCTCGRKGCIEAYASVTGLIRTTKEMMLENKDSVMWSLVSGDINRVSGRTPFEAMKKGDAVACKVVDIYIEHLACGIVNFINTFQPEMLFIGGAISKEGNYILDPLNKILHRDLYNRKSKMQTKIACAILGNDAGIIGAAMLGKL